MLDIRCLRLMGPRGVLLALAAMVAIVGGAATFSSLMKGLRVSSSSSSSSPTSNLSIVRNATTATMARDPSSSSVIWLHGLGDNGPNNAPLQHALPSPSLRSVRWHFPSAPSHPVSANYGAVMPSWFDISEIPITSKTPPDEEGLLKAVKTIHEMLDREVEAGTSPERIFLCGFSQGGALTLASALLYPRTLAGAAIFSGWVAFTANVFAKATREGKKTPLLWLHGTDDPTVKFEAGRSAQPVLAEQGINCEFKAFPGLGHSISSAEIAYLDQWMNSRVKSFVV